MLVAPENKIHIFFFYIILYNLAVSISHSTKWARMREEINICTQCLNVLCIYIPTKYHCMHAMNMYFIFFRRVLTPHSSRSHRRRIHTLCMWECHGLCVLFPAIDITTLLIMYVIVLRPFFFIFIRFSSPFGRSSAHFYSFAGWLMVWQRQ